MTTTTFHFPVRVRICLQSEVLQVGLIGAGTPLVQKANDHTEKLTMCSLQAE